MGLREVVERFNWQHLLVLVLLDIELDVFSEPDVSNLHLIEGQSSRLIGANVSSTAHNLASSKLLDVILILEHFALRVGERDHDSERETLWDGDNNNSNTDDDIVNPEFKVLGKRSVILVLASKEINVALEETVKEVTEKEDVNGQ